MSTESTDPKTDLPLEYDGSNDDQNSSWEECQSLIQLGQAAYRYGSTVDRVEHFMESTARMRLNCENNLVCATRTEVFCSFGSHALTMVRIQDGVDLNKLALLSQAAINLIEGKSTIVEATNELCEIEKTADPWNSLAVFAAYLAVGSGLPVLLGGNWWDVLFGLVVSIPAFGISILFSRSKSLSKFIPLATSFVVTVIAAGSKYAFSDLNELIVVISGVAIILPGYAITLGTSELTSDHIIAGISRLVSGLITLCWLLAGAWLGSNLVNGLGGELNREEGEPVPDRWQALFAPLVFLGLAVIFQNSYQDTPWAIANQGVAYGTTFLSRLPNVSDNLANFVASFSMTVTANIWGRWKDRPPCIVLIPAVIIMVSGSSGFRGLVYLFSPNGTPEEGWDELGNMFEVAVMIIAGLLVGNMVVVPNTTL